MVTLESSGREMAREMGRGRTEESEMQNADHNPHAQHVHHLKYKMFSIFLFLPVLFEIAPRVVSVHLPIVFGVGSLRKHMDEQARIQLVVAGK